MTVNSFMFSLTFLNCFSATAMVIGFTERSLTVSEGIAPPWYDVFPLLIEVATLRTAEREHPMVFRIQEATSSAIVEPIGDAVNQLFDATFGTRDNIDDPIEELFVLEALEGIIPPRTTFIRNDLRPEDEECFTIRTFPVDIPGRRELFTCSEDDAGESSYFCHHTICIEDDDGRFAEFCKANVYPMFQSHLLLHLWRQPTQLMRVLVQ